MHLRCGRGLGWLCARIIGVLRQLKQTDFLLVETLKKARKMSQQYNLRWNNHQSNFISMFTTLLNTQLLLDVTLIAEGKQLLAHKVVLAACSTYFESIFVSNPSPHPVVVLKDVTYADLRTIVDFMYRGVVNVSEERLRKVLDTAKLLKIKGLTEMPDSTSLPGFFEQGSSQSSSAWPSIKRTSQTSTGSTPFYIMENDHGRADVASQTVEPTTTISSMPKQWRMHEHHEILTVTTDNAQQTTDEINVNLVMENSTPAAIPQGQWIMLGNSYPRYTNACIGAGTLQQDPMCVNNVINPDMDMGVAGPSPGPSCVDVPAPAEPAPAEPAPAEPAPPAPAPPKRRRTKNPQSKENFQRALEAVRFGGIGFCKAASMFGVSNSTLWLEYKKKGYPNNRPSLMRRTLTRAYDAATRAETGEGTSRAADGAAVPPTPRAARFPRLRSDTKLTVTDRSTKVTPKPPRRKL